MLFMKRLVSRAQEDDHLLAGHIPFVSACLSLVGVLAYAQLGCSNNFVHVCSCSCTSLLLVIFWARHSCTAGFLLCTLLDRG